MLYGTVVTMQDLRDVLAFADAVDDAVRCLDKRVCVLEGRAMDESEMAGCDSMECPGRDELLAYQGFEQDGKQRINEALYALVPAGMTMGEFDELTCEVFYKIRAVWDKQMDSSKR